MPDETVFAGKHIIIVLNKNTPENVKTGSTSYRFLRK
jgi:hypothetical protein